LKTKAVALTVAQYQQKNPQTYRNQTLKVILTNHNAIEDRDANILSYFSTYFNQGVPPSGFVWAPGVIFGEPTQRNPWQSMQIFQEYLDSEMLLQALSPVNPSPPSTYWNITTSIFNCTTVNNPAFGVLAGQKVQFMLIRINSAIPTNIFTVTAIDRWAKPMADMALDIATDPVLSSRIRQFVSS
jgi:hypothetical protein